MQVLNISWVITGSRVNMKLFNTYQKALHIARFWLYLSLNIQALQE